MRRWVFGSLTVGEWNLQAEDVIYKDDPVENLKLNGATPEEVQFLCHTDWEPYRGRRVELNAFTSDQFVEWLDRKLTSQEVKKVIPARGPLEQAYRRAAAAREYQKIIDDAQEQVIAYAKDLMVPHDLAERLAAVLGKDPTLSWDEAVRVLVDGDGEGLRE